MDFLLGKCRFDLELVMILKNQYKLIYGVAYFIISNKYQIIIANNKA